MHPEGIKEFPHYYVGIDTLKDFAVKEDRVCVLNITGGESRGVTPISHSYSNGNIVCGTAPRPFRHGDEDLCRCDSHLR